MTVMPELNNEDDMKKYSPEMAKCLMYHEQQPRSVSRNEKEE